MAKKLGRPPAGRDATGRAVSTRTYPQLTVRIPPGTKDDLDLLAFMQRRTQAEVIQRAVDAYKAALTAAERKSLEGLRALRRDAGR